MYRIVLLTGLGVLLVHEQVFHCEMVAQQKHAEKYMQFPGLEIWKQWQVDEYTGGPKVQFSEVGEVTQYYA